MRKKILFVIPEYIHGGTNKSLENLISFIDKTKYEISIISVFEYGSDYYKKIFKPYLIKKSFFYYLAHDNFITRKIVGFGMKLFGKKNWNWLYKKECKYLQDKHHFDTVVAYQEGYPTRFVSHFNGVNKVAWFHSPHMTVIKDKKRDLQYYSTYNHIVCVSDCFTNYFNEMFPSLKDRTISIYNTLNQDVIRMMGKENIGDENFDTNVFSIVSVGRFAKMKQFHLIPDIVNQINKLGKVKPYKWYIIASGDQCLQQTLNKIEKYNLKDTIILLGAKDNPYPFMKMSDLVVCTSDAESFSYVIAEGKILHTPVVSNNFPVAYEVLNNNCGYISSIDEMPELLYKLINDENGIYSKVKETITSYEYENEDIMKKVSSILDNK